MRISYSTLAILFEHGDAAAATMIQVWKQECGILWEPEYLQVYYRGKKDRFIVYVWNKARVIAPNEWNLPSEDVVEDFDSLEQEQLNSQFGED